MKGYFKRELRKVQRPFKRMKGYIQFFKQKGLYKELDASKIRRWPDEMLEEEEKKVKKRKKIIEKFENWPKKILSIILTIFIVIAIIRPKIYWVATFMTVVVFVLYITGYVVLLVACAKAKETLEKNAVIVWIEKSRRAINRQDYSHIEAIDSPELCAILAKITEPIIDEIRCENEVFYNVYVHGRCYRLIQEHKIEEKIKMTD